MELRLQSLFLSRVKNISFNEKKTHFNEDYIMITKHSFNYGMVYLPNGCIMKEGYLEKWEYSGSGSYVTLVFADGFMVKAGVSVVYLLHKDEEES